MSIRVSSCQPPTSLRVALEKAHPIAIRPAAFARKAGVGLIDARASVGLKNATN
jgi:hypothetical protein